jgi:hypothetical protein
MVITEAVLQPEHDATSTGQILELSAVAETQLRSGWELTWHGGV